VTEKGKEGVVFHEACLLDLHITRICFKAHTCILYFCWIERDWKLRVAHEKERKWRLEVAVLIARIGKCFGIKSWS
jgi:hypothetical protein